MADLIDRKALSDEIRSLRMTITGLRNGKGALALYAKEYRDTVLQIIDEQATVEPEHKSAEEMFREAGYHLDYSNRGQTLYRKDTDTKCFIELDTDGCYRGYENAERVGGYDTLGMSWTEVAACLRWKQEQGVTGNG